MGRVDGKVAFITGIARGQGRSHAITLAREGADIIGLDYLDTVDESPAPASTQADLDETVRQVEALGRRIVVDRADVRRRDQVDAVLERGVSELGRLDIVSANAGINSLGSAEEITEAIWTNMIDINLTGVWHTTQASIPHCGQAVEADRSSSLVPLQASPPSKTSPTTSRPSTASPD